MDTINKIKTRKILNAVIEHLDYDMWKERFNEETCEYGQDVDTNFDELIDVVEEVLEQEEQ